MSLTSDRALLHLKARPALIFWIESWTLLRRSPYDVSRSYGTTVLYRTLDGSPAIQGSKAPECIAIF